MTAPEKQPVTVMETIAAAMPTLAGLVLIGLTIADVPLDVHVDPVLIISMLGLCGVIGGRAIDRFLRGRYDYDRRDHEDR